LAEKAGISQQLIGKIESCDVSKPGSLEEIAKALQVSYSWIKHGAADISNKSVSSNIDSFILTADSSIDEAINTMIIINGQRGLAPNELNIEVLKRAFKISLRGKLTGDYVTAAINVDDIKRPR
jgi:transcriptional regulator with XRE-family HTH domain